MAGKRVITNQNGEPKFSNPKAAPTPSKPFFFSRPGDMNEMVESSYDPEHEGKFQQKTISLAELYAKAVIPRTMKGADGKEYPTRIAGQFVLHEGAARRVVEVNGWDNLRRLTETQAYQVAKLREATGAIHARRTVAKYRAMKESGPDKFKEDYGSDWFALGADGTGGATSTGNTFHPLTLGPFSRNLYLYDFLDQASKAFEAWNHNPLAKAIIMTFVHFILADGFKVKMRSATIQPKFDEWCDRVNWNEKWRLMVKDAEIIGETFLFDPDGLSMTVWDATTVWEIVTNPRNINDVFYAYRQFPTQWQMPLSAAGQTMPEGVPVQDYVIEQFPPDQWCQVKLNSTVGEKRGRSTLFPALSWLKRFRDWFNAAVEKAYINNAFVIWWQINGSDADVQAMKGNTDFTTMPNPGSAWFTNMQVTPKLLTNEGGLGSADKTGEALMTIIATSVGFPPEYLGVAGTGARATGIKRGEPAMKMFESRQQIWREVITWKVKRWIKAAIREGDIPSTEPMPATIRQLLNAARGRQFKTAMTILAALVTGKKLEGPIDQGFEVIMPQLQPEDQAAQLKNLAVGRATGVYSQESYATHYAELMNARDYDYDAEKEMIDHEAEQGIFPPGSASALPDGQPGEEDKVTPGSSEDVSRYKANAQDRPKAPTI